MAARRRCLACSRAFKVFPQVPEQNYCSAPACQRERRKLWQRTARQDPDYQANQADAQEAWLERNPDYWRQYRTEHPEYAQKNREKQRERNRARRAAEKIAKKNSSPQRAPLISGVYRLTISPDAEIAKMDSWTVQLERLDVG